MTQVTATGDDSTRRSIAGKIAAHSRWSNLDADQRTAATAKSREALEEKWLREADGDPVRAANLRKLHYARMAQKSHEVRRRKRQLARAEADLAAAQAEAGIDANEVQS